MINVFQPQIGNEEIDAVRNVLESGWLGKGKLTARLESAWAAHVGTDARHIVSTNSATEGLFAVLKILSDEGVRDVVMPSIHFIGAGNAALAAGMRIHYCDVDSRTLNAQVSDIDAAWPRGRSPVAVVLLHYGGLPCEMGDILELVRGKPHAWLIEDAACAPASRTLNTACGTFGDFGVWSFDAMKIITMGDGGMVYCSSPEMADRMRKALYLGMDGESGLSRGGERWWEFASDGDGRRSITNDIAAAIGLAQLDKLRGFVKRRREIHRMYSERLIDLDWLSLPPFGPESSFCFYWIQCDDRDGLARHLRNRDIYTTFRYWPLHRALSRSIRLPRAEWAADHTLLLPLHQGLSDSDVHFICDQIMDYGRERVTAAHGAIA